MDHDVIGICLIGCGRAGMLHARNYNRRIPGARMIAVVDVIEDNAKSAAEELGITAWYTDYREALKNPGVDAVIVVSPTDMHKGIVCDCAAAGKHVFCEKPMAMNAAECKEMIAVCNQNNVKLQIGFMRRFDKSFINAKKVVESGEIGDVVLIRSNTRGPSKPRPWMYDLKKSNGILAEVCSHDIDTIRWFSKSEVTELYAIAGNYRNPEAVKDYPDYYDNVVMNGRFENGIQFSIDGATYVQYGYDSHVEILGTKGVIHIGRNEDAFIKCTTVDNGTATPFVNSWMTLFTDAYIDEDVSFVQSIQHDMTPCVTGKDGLWAVRIVEAGNESIRTHSIITL